MTELQIKQSSDDRIQVTQTPLALPGHCAICFFAGGPDHNGRQFVDFGLSLEFYGAVIICTDCILTVVRILGFISPDEYRGLKEQNENLTISVSEKEAEIAKLVNALGAIDSVRHYISSNAAGGDSEKGSPDKGPGKSGTKPDDGSSESSNSGGHASLRKANSSSKSDETFDDSDDEFFGT